MNDLSQTQILTTERDGRILSILFGFKPAQPAVNTWRFIHTENSMLLRIFTDEEALPIAMQFADLVDPDEMEEVPEESREAILKKLYAFACTMIEYGQIKEGEHILKQSLEGLELPPFPDANAAIRRARTIPPASNRVCA